ncbi:MAG: hypothetical protein J6R47_05440 [Acholeplasmatales bacterium]|nr:hypothetical protein [Acholeplasmatales bacterium]
MTFYKPLKISYTDMCIWIDDNMYKEDCDEAKLYEYLYHIINMFARKNSYFRSEACYDEFALSSASRLFMRIKDSRLTEIKSILNYIKTIIYPYKVDFEKDVYAESPQDNAFIYTDSYCLSTSLLDEIDLFDKIDFKYTLDDICTIIKRYLSKIPYKKNSSEWLNIYTSCLLTFLASIKFESKIKLTKQDITDKELHSLYLASQQQDVVLYHLDRSYSNYIKILVNELKSLIAKELSIEQHSQISSENALKSIIIASMESEE